jgi:hypothetical protein
MKNLTGRRPKQISILHSSIAIPNFKLRTGLVRMALRNLAANKGRRNATDEV